ncbi:MAG: hypothetical protein DMF76_03460 [Acidobacteria bacterium]|nr:MAG: hypothetical protein DMF76_03460 [Acidobacteriota bacterium]
MFAKRFNYKILLILLLLVIPDATQAERLPIRTYTVADGLANNTINKIVRDSRGFLWFCTADGISRFDGYEFRSFGTNEGLPHPYVNDLVETRSGEYWIATNGGLAGFHPRGAPAQSIDASSKGEPLFSVVLPEDSDRRARAITALFEDRSGTLWCGTMKGLYRLDRANGHFMLRPVDVGIPNEYPEQALINGMVEDQKSSLWIATPSGLYRRWPDGAFARYTTRDGLPGEHLHDLFIDHKGQLWAASRLNGFFSFTPDATRKPPVITHAFSTKDGLPQDWIFQLFESSDQKFWVATARGLAQYLSDGDGQGHFIHSYSERNGLTHHDINALNEDAAGNLWLASPAGAMKLARNGFTTYDQQDGIDEVDALFADRRGNVCARGWLLGDGRVSIFEGAKFDVLHSNLGQHVPRFGCFNGQKFTWLLPGALDNRVMGWVGEGLTLRGRNGEWWIGTGSGVYRFPAADDLTKLSTARPLAVYTTKDGLSASQVFRLFADSRGNIWISTIGSVNGLALWDAATRTLRDLSNVPGLIVSKEDLAHSFAEDRDGNVWIGFAGGLARYREGHFIFFTNKEGLPNGGIAQIYLDRSTRLWLASSRSGLIRVENTSSDRPTFVSFTTQQGLSSDITSVITEGLDGHIYVGTGRGLDELDPATARIKHFTTADGLISGAMLSAFRDQTGALGFGTQKGLSRFVPASDKAAAAPPILITQLSVSGSPQRVAAFGEEEISLVDFPASQNQVQVDFVGLSFASGEVLRYQYKLAGAGKDWSAPNEQRTVNFASLAPGKYTFMVRAVNSEGQASSNPAILRFTILPHFWQRWWFVLLTVMTAGLIIYTLYRYRMQKLIELERVRTRIATDLHDEIGSNLSLIAMIGEAARRRAANDSQMAGWLSTIAGTSRETVDAMSDIVWAVNPGKDRLSDLTQRMRRVAEEALSPRDVTLDFSAPDKADIKLDADTRREVFMIFKEGLNNIVRHSQCTKVAIDFRVASGRLSLKVSDSGRGFEVGLATEGNGLVNMRRRAEKLKGRLEIDSKADEGTTVRLSVPIDGHRRLGFPVR